MAIIITTTNAAGLLQKLKKAIDDQEIVTWSYDEDGDFTHTPDQWAYKAWLRPNVKNGELAFGILKRRDEDLSMVVYGIYHGRFIEMFLSHFDCDFTNARATAQKAEPDNF